MGSQQLWRLDAEHSDLDDHRSIARYFLSEQAARWYADQLTGGGFYCDYYLVELAVSDQVVQLLLAGDFPNVSDEKLIALARDPVDKAGADLARILDRKRKGA